jgi:Predicted hydrolase (metallo-beta-lactamase superfamily)
MPKGTFHSYPVGQGFFYSGKIEYSNNTFNFVYDCCKQSVKNHTDSELIGLIDYYVDTNIKNHCLDMLVISHFDNDHVNGISYLLKKISHIDYLVIPYHDEFDLYMLNLFLFFTDPLEQINNVILINSTENGERRFVENSENLSLPLFERKNYKVSLKSSFHPLAGIWNFDFFNLSISVSEYNDLHFELQTLLNGDSFENFIRQSPASVEKIRRIFESTLSKSHTKNDTLNNSSLCLYHSPVFNEKATKLFFPHYFYRNSWPFEYLHYFHKKRGTLLTGDINLSIKKRWTEFHRHYHYIQNDICINYLPHHGSYRNWNKELRNYLDDCLAVVSVGKSNIYNHPSSILVQQLFDKQIPLIICDENYPFKYQIY